MFERIATILIASLIAIQSLAMPIAAKVGDYVLIRGEIEDCPQFPGVIGAPTVRSDGTILFLGLEPLQVLDLTEFEIRHLLVQQIAEKRTDRQFPSSISIELLETEQSYRLVRKEILAGVSFLARSRCDTRPTPRIENDLHIHERRYRIAAIDA